MALEPIRPKDLPPSVTVYATDRIPSDDGVNVGGALPVQIVDAGAPVPSEATAIAGIDNVSRMTPFLTRAVLNDETAPSVLLAQAWAESPSPPIPGSKSSKTWAGESAASAADAQASAIEAALYGGFRQPNIAGAKAVTAGMIPVGANLWIEDIDAVWQRAPDATPIVNDYPMQFIPGGPRWFAVAPFTFEQFGCNNTEDSAVPFLRALHAAQGEPIRIGKVRLDTRVTYDGRVNIWSPGNGGRIDCSGGGGLSFIGGLEAIPKVSGVVPRGTNTYSFVSAHGLAEDDVFCMYNPTDYSFSPARPYYRQGDWVEVGRVDSVTQITSFGTSYAVSMTGSDYDCYKMLGKGVSVLGVTFTPPPTLNALQVHEHRDVFLRVGCDRGIANAAIQVLRCYSGFVEMLPTHAHLLDAYPIIIGNSKRFRVDASLARSNRHVLALGGDTGPGGVPTREIQINNCNLINLAGTMGAGASDMHGNCEDVVYSNCIIEHANMSGRNVAYVNCTINARNTDIFPDGTCIFGSEVNGGLFRIHNCVLNTGGDGALFGLIHLGTANLSTDFNLDIRGLVVNHHTPAASSTVRIINIASGPLPAPHTKRVDVTIDGLSYLGSDVLAVVTFSGPVDISTTASLSIQNINRLPPCVLAVMSNPVNAAMPMRLPRQTITEEFTYTTAEIAKTAAVGAPVKWIYPRQPVASVSIHGASDATFNPGTTNIAIPYIYKLNASSVRLGVKSSSGTVFSIADNVKVTSEVWIDDL